MKYLIFSFHLLLTLSCTKDEIEEVITTEGTLAWYGDPAADGCGLVLETDAGWYLVSSKKNEVMEFLEEDFHRIEVNASFIIVGKETTGWGCNPTPVKITKIERK